MEQYLPIVTIAICLVAPFAAEFQWVPAIVVYLSIYVPWKMQKILAEVKKMQPEGKALASLERIRSSLKSGRKK